MRTYCFCTCTYWCGVSLCSFFCTPLTSQSVLRGPVKRKIFLASRLVSDFYTWATVSRNLSQLPILSQLMCRTTSSEVITALRLWCGVNYVGSRKSRAVIKWKSKPYTNNLRTTAYLNHTDGTRKQVPKQYVVVMWSHCCLVFVRRVVEWWSFCVSHETNYDAVGSFLFSYFSIYLLLNNFLQLSFAYVWTNVSRIDTYSIEHSITANCVNLQPETKMTTI